MRKTSIIGFVLATLLFSGATYAYSHVFWLATIGSSSFIKKSEHIFIDPELEEVEYQRALLAINEGKERIRRTFGSYKATPVIVITGTSENAQKYGLGAFPAKAYAAPWNEYVVVNYQAENVDLIAHELMHAQMRETLGYWAYQTGIPTWFDEGVAMQVDLRDRYEIDPVSFPSEEIERVKSLSKPSKFWTDSKEQDINNYRAAKAAVYQMLEKYPPNSLYSMLLNIRQGQEFSDVFGE